MTERQVKLDLRNKQKPWAIKQDGKIVGRSTSKRKAEKSTSIANEYDKTKSAARLK